ncbi:ankyrin repeat-containing protein bda1 [Quercus suber]|uniref:Ankyrin repeat-containing protein bda1 n=1 Tax=Quercus suber TaxID=58331 RepID=A0AAW0LL43_QUESU
MEVRREEDDILELYNASMSGSTTPLYRLIHNDPRLLAVELDSHKRCPLHLASAEGHVDIVRALLHANSNACLIRDQDGRIPLHYAVIRGGVEVVKEFIITRPDSTQVMLDGGETVLHLRVKHNQLEALKLLVESVSDKGDFLNSKDHDGGNTILQLAVMLKQVELLPITTATDENEVEQAKSLDESVTYNTNGVLRRTIKYLLLVPKVKEAVDFLNNTGFTALEMLEHCPKDFKSFTIRNILMYAGVSIKRVNNPSPPLAIAVGHSESVQEQSSKKGRRNWFGYLKYEGDWVEDNHGSIMVVSTVITTITFQQTISPPGGLWQENVIDTMQGFRCSLNTPCLAGKAVLADAFDYWNYLYYMICNTLSFVASLGVTFLLITGFPIKHIVCMCLLTISLCSTLTFLDPKSREPWNALAHAPWKMKMNWFEVLRKVKVITSN